MSLVAAYGFNEGSGVHVGDASGNGHYGLALGGMTWPASYDGSAETAGGFDGDNARVVILDDAALDLSSAFTIMCWIRPGQAATQTLIKKAQTGSAQDADGWELALASSGITFVRVNEDTSGNTFRVDSTTPYPTNNSTWQHVAATYDGSTLRIFVNGNEEASVAGPSAVLTNDLDVHIGEQADGSNPFLGAIDDVRIYNEALDESAIAALMNTPVGDAPFDPQEPKPIAGTSAASLSSPAGRAGKGQRWAWYVPSLDRWDAVLPTSSGWRFFTDVLSANPVQGAVVDDRQNARVDCLFDPDTDSLWVLRGHPSTPRITRYDHSGGSYTADPDITDISITALSASDNDASPLTLHRSPNGRLWAAVAKGSSVVVGMSSNNGQGWATASVITGLSETGVAMLTHTGTTVVLIVTLNDGAGRFVRTISQSAGSITAGSWSSETLPSLPAGITSDDHGQAVTIDGHIYAASKTTGAANASQPLLYLLDRSPGGTWTQTTLVPGPDDGETRPTLVATETGVYVTWGASTDPFNAELVAILRSPLALGTRRLLIRGPEWFDGVVAPRAAGGRGVLWLAHNLDDNMIWRVWTPNPVGSSDVGLPALTADLSGTVSGPDSSLDATLPALEADLSGAIIPDGSIDAALPALEADFDGLVTFPIAGPLDAELPALEADFEGQADIAGSIDATLPALDVELSSEIEGQEKWFTPPHRNRFVPPTDPDVPGSMHQPWLSMRGYVPRPPNIWVWPDGTLHEDEQPPGGYTHETRVYMGGHVYGPLTQEQVDELVAAGYGEYIHDAPTPPEP